MKPTLRGRVLEIYQLTERYAKSRFHSGVVLEKINMRDFTEGTR